MSYSVPLQQRVICTKPENARTLSTGSIPGEDFSNIMGRIIPVLGYKAAMLYVLSEDRESLVLKHACGIREIRLTSVAGPLSRSDVDNRVLGGEVVALPEARSENSLLYSQIAQEEGLQSMLAVPYRIGGRVTGVLRVYTAEVHAFGPDEQALWSEIANICARSSQSNDCFDTLQRLSSRLNLSLDLNSVLKTLLSESLAQLGLTAGSIRLLGSTGNILHLAAASGFSNISLKREVDVRESRLDQYALQQAEPIAVTDVKEDVELEPGEMPFEDVRSVVLLPLQVRDTRLGVMRLYSTEVKQFTPEEIRLIRALAEVGAIAIENAKLHQLLTERLDAMKEHVDGWYRFLAFS
jgi:GAF domain-containing protein